MFWVEFIESVDIDTRRETQNKGMYPDISLLKSLQMSEDSKKSRNRHTDVSSSFFIHVCARYEKSTTARFFGTSDGRKLVRQDRRTDADGGRGEGRAV